MTVELTIGDYLSMAEWYATLPPAIKELVRRFPPGSKWKIRGGWPGRLPALLPLREGDYFCPENFLGNEKIQMRLISGASGEPLAATCIVRPMDLIPAGN